MAEIEIDDMNIDINMGATVHMEELKSILEQIVAAFREIAQGTANNVNAAVKGIKQSGKDLVESSEEVAKNIKNAVFDTKKEFNSMLREATGYLNKPIQGVEKLLSGGLKELGGSFSEIISSGLSGAMKATPEAGSMASMIMPGGMLGGAGAATATGGAGAATAATGGAILPILAALAVIVVAIAVLTKIIEIGFGILEKTIGAFFEPINTVLGAIVKILTVPMKLLGSVFAEVMIPYLEMSMMFIRIFMPLIQKFREDYHNIFDSIIEEGGGTMEAAYGAGYGAMTGFMFNLFEPLMTAMHDISATLQYTILGYLLVAIQTFANKLIDLMNPLVQWFGFDAVQHIDLLGGSLDDFVENNVKRSREEFKNLYDATKNYAVSGMTDFGREVGKIVDNMLPDLTTEVDNTAEALEELTKVIKEAKDAFEKEKEEPEEEEKKYSKNDIAPPPPKPDIPFAQNQMSQWIGNFMGQSGVTDIGKSQEKNVTMKGSIELKGSDLFVSQLGDAVVQGLKAHLETLEGEGKTSRTDLNNYSNIQFNV